MVAYIREYASTKSITAGTGSGVYRASPGLITAGTRCVRSWLHVRTIRCATEDDGGEVPLLLVCVLECISVCVLESKSNEASFAQVWHSRACG
jgi:hypothetical protein